MRKLITILLCFICLASLPLNGLAKEKRCAKCCPTSTSFTGYLTDNWKIRLATKEGLKEYNLKITKHYSDGNFDYNIEKVSEIDSLASGNGTVYHALVSFTLPVITGDFLRSWDCQAVITADKFWKGDCTAVGFDKFGKLEFLLAPLTLEKE